MRKLMMRPKVLCAACLSTALISGMGVYRAVFRGVAGPELALSTDDPVGAADSSSSAAMRESAGVADAATAGGTTGGAAASSAPNTWVEEDKRLRAAVPPPPAGSVMENARSVYEEMSSEILAKWGPEYEDTLFSGGMSFSDGGTVVEDKMLRAVVQQGDFLAAFTGISITAGHDCLFEQSYPVLLNATMSRIMATAGVRFEAINVAMGNSRSSPYSFCVDAHAGIEADIVSWEMSLELTDYKCGPAAQAIELFVRSATVLPKRPAVLVMDAMPDQDMCDEHRFNIVSRRNEGFMGHCGNEPDPEKDLMRVYREFGLHQFSPSTLVPTYTCGDERFARSLLYGAGKHFPRPMSWHPAPAGHALVADMLFMHYAKVFFSALDRLEEVAPDWTVTQFIELSAPSRESLGASLGLGGEGGDSAQASTGGVVAASDDRDGGRFMGGGRGSVLPRPVWCKGWRFCEGAGNYRCANTYSPLAGKNGSRLVDMVSERTPVVNGKHGSILMPPRQGHWAVTLNEVKVPILEYLKTTPPEGMHHPIDMKWVLVGNAKSGPIEFEFETVGVVPVGTARGEAGGADTAVETERSANSTAVAGVPRVAATEGDPRVVVCRPDFIDRVELDDKAGVRYSVDGVETSPVGLVSQYGLHKGSCVLLAAEVGVGRHTLAVEPLKTGKPFVAISHVLYPA